MCCVSRLVLISSVCLVVILFFFFKQKTAYELRISDWSSDVCSSDLVPIPAFVNGHCRRLARDELRDCRQGRTPPPDHDSPDPEQFPPCEDDDRWLEQRRRPPLPPYRGGYGRRTASRRCLPDRTRSPGAGCRDGS